MFLEASEASHHLDIQMSRRRSPSNTRSMSRGRSKRMRSRSKRMRSKSRSKNRRSRSKSNKRKSKGGRKEKEKEKDKDKELKDSDDEDFGSTVSYLGMSGRQGVHKTWKLKVLCEEAVDTFHSLNTTALSEDQVDRSIFIACGLLPKTLIKELRLRQGQGKMHLKEMIKVTPTASQNYGFNTNNPFYAGDNLTLDLEERSQGVDSLHSRHPILKANHTIKGRPSTTQASGYASLEGPIYIAVPSSLQSKSQILTRKQTDNNTVQLPAINQS